mgnify:CR=1 FL=1
MIIAICGHKFSGKSTVARLLSEATGYEVVSFADKLKDVCCVLSGCTREDLENYDFKENKLVPEYLKPYCLNAQKPTFRAFLQHFGTDIMRSFNDNIWIDSTLGNDSKNVIVSDVRFPNEAKAIKDRGGLIIKVIRDSVVASDKHQSETHIDDIQEDCTLFNNTTLEELAENVEILAIIWKKEKKL